MKNGNFIISLDYEIFWGISETKGLNNYGENLLNTDEVVIRLLKLFTKYEISATWAIVGFLFFEDKTELKTNVLNIQKPTYLNENLSNYNFIDIIEDNKKKVYFSKERIDQIRTTQNQEIATHTFSHYYCLEDGQSLEQFEEDLRKAIEVAEDNHITFESIVFPRNQYSDSHIEICKSHGIKTYRGNEKHWIYKPSASQGFIRRGFRLLDAYVNISGDNTFVVEKNDEIVNITSSRFLRPYNRKLNFVEGLRKQRILKEMTYAAKNNKCYHLWWHPHNFGKDIEENFKFLEEILIHYTKLNQEFNFESTSMNKLLKHT